MEIEKSKGGIYFPKSKEAESPKPAPKKELYGTSQCGYRVYQENGLWCAEISYYDQAWYVIEYNTEEEAIKAGRKALKDLIIADSDETHFVKIPKESWQLFAKAYKWYGRGGIGDIRRSSFDEHFQKFMDMLWDTEERGFEQYT